MNLIEPRDQMDKSTVRRGWLLVLVIMAVFIALTKLFPDTPRGMAPAQQMTDVTTPGH